MTTTLSVQNPQDYVQYQWQRQDANGNITDVQGQTASSITVSVDDGGAYRVRRIVPNAYGNRTTSKSWTQTGVCENDNWSVFKPVSLNLSCNRAEPRTPPDFQIDPNWYTGNMVDENGNEIRDADGNPIPKTGGELANQATSTGKYKESIYWLKWGQGNQGVPPDNPAAGYNYWDWNLNGYRYDTPGYGAIPIKEGASVTFTAPHSKITYTATIEDINYHIPNPCDRCEQGARLYAFTNGSYSWNNLPSTYNWGTGINTNDRNRITGRTSATTRYIGLGTHESQQNSGPKRRVSFRIRVTAVKDGAEVKDFAYVLAGSESLGSKYFRKSNNEIIRDTGCEPHLKTIPEVAAATGIPEDDIELVQEFYSLEIPEATEAPNATIQPIEVFKAKQDWDLSLQRTNNGRKYKVTALNDGSGDIMLAATRTPYVNVEVFDTGGQHVAIGIIDQMDTGDAPDSFEGNTDGDNFAKHYIFPALPAPKAGDEIEHWNSANPPREESFIKLTTPTLGIGKYLDAEPYKHGGNITSLADAKYAKMDDNMGAQDKENGKFLWLDHDPTDDYLNPTTSQPYGTPKPANDEDGIPGGIWYGVCDGSIKVHNYGTETAYLKIWASQGGSGTTFDENNVVTIPVEAGFNGYKFVRFTDLGIPTEKWKTIW